MRHDKSFQNCIEIWCVRVTRVAAYVKQMQKKKPPATAKEKQMQKKHIAGNVKGLNGNL
jgi:hypothetical protein